MTRPPVADFQAIAGEMVSANVKSTNKILAGSEFVESWAGSRTIRQPTPAARASAAIWLENMRSWTNARTLISSGIRGVYTRTRTFSPLLRYSGGGQGWGPNFQSALDKPPPYPSPGVPGEGKYGCVACVYRRSGKVAGGRFFCGSTRVFDSAPAADCGGDRGILWGQMAQRAIALADLAGRRR